MGQTNKRRTHPREKYRVSNWSTYNKALISRGDITIWFDDNVKNNWFYIGDRKPGGKIEYSDVAIEFLMLIKYSFHLTFRQLEGFATSMVKMWNIEDIKIPCYSQIQRRSSKVDHQIKIRNTEKQALQVVIDSTGLKVYGEGEWKVRKHGWGKRRTWRKIHMVSDGNDLEILSVVVTGNDVDDSTGGIEAINKIDESIHKLIGDGAYDKVNFRNNLPGNIEQIIPPQENAVISEVIGLEQRNEAIKRIKEVGRQKWKEELGYHNRSKSEVNMFRYKTIFTEKLNSRKIKNEKREVELKCKILNKYAELGMPKSYKIA
jgi:hypothetical protein